MQCGHEQTPSSALSCDIRGWVSVELLGSLRISKPSDIAQGVQANLWITFPGSRGLERSVQEDVPVGVLAGTGTRTSGLARFRRGARMPQGVRDKQFYRTSRGRHSPVHPAIGSCRSLIQALRGSRGDNYPMCDLNAGAG